MTTLVLPIWYSLGGSFHSQRNSFNLAWLFCPEKTEKGLANDSNMHFLDFMKGREL